MIDPREVAFALKGTVVNPKPDRSIEILPDWLVAVDELGFISHFEPSGSARSVELLQATEHGHIALVEMGLDEWILPGFVDTHIHAPQYPNAGVALDKPLMEWLEHYTFKAESRIDRDPVGYGKQVYERLVERLKENGTTSASVFGTISAQANLVLAKCFLAGGVRGQIGKVSMDRNSPSYYVETTRGAINAAREFVDAVWAMTSDLAEHERIVEPVVTPRFVPTCSVELLAGLVDLAKARGVRIQSHMAESQGEVDLCKAMLGGKTDVELFSELGVLSPRSLMAHCTHSLATDLSLLASTGTSVAHCPLSNVYFSPERQLPLREAWRAGVKVGLGSDISGGYRVGLEDGMRWAVGVSKLRQGAAIASEGSDSVDSTQKDGANACRPDLSITWRESLYLATLGGAQALGLASSPRCVGSFGVGHAFDAQRIQVGGRGSAVEWFAEDERGESVGIEDKVERWWCNGGVADRRQVWVQGREVYSA